MIPKNKTTLTQDNIVTSESDIWNIAGGFVVNKILIPLVKLDKYMNMAYFGCEELTDEGFISDSQKAINKYRGLKWSVYTLRSILGSAIFVIKQPDIKKYRGYITHLDLISKYTESILIQRKNGLTHEVVHSINDKLFKQCYEILQRIKDEINIPLNNAGLIFKKGEEFNLDKIMGDIIGGG